MKAGEVVVFDKAYIDFKHLKTLSNKSTHKKRCLEKTGLLVLNRTPKSLIS